MEFAPPPGGADDPPLRAIVLDASYSTGSQLTGVGIYSRELMAGLAAAHPRVRFVHSYRWPSIRQGWRAERPANASWEWRFGGAAFGVKSGGALFHGLNQRLPRRLLEPHSVVTFHDLFVLTGEYSTPEFRQRFAEQARDAARRAELIIAVSQFTARAVTDLLGVERSRIRVIPHGYRFRPSSSAISRQREELVLHVGAIQKRKNIARLVRAFENLPAGWRLVLAGAKGGYGAERELAAVEASPRRRDIAVLGHVEDEELAALYARASIFAFPSLDEGFGIPILEAMACGVPVVASDRSALPEAAGDAALLVNPEDQEALAGALRQLALDPALRERLVQLGLARARQFPWERAIERTWSVYRELL